MSYLWEIEDIERLLSSPEVLVREWAVDKVNSLFLDQAGRLLAPRLDEEDYPLFAEIVRVMAGAADAQEYVDLLAEKTRAETGRRFGHLVLALAGLGSPEVPELVQARFERSEAGKKPAEAELIGCVRALGRSGGSMSRNLLWDLVRSEKTGLRTLDHAVSALVRVAADCDIRDLILYTRERSTAFAEQVLMGMAAALGVVDDAEDILDGLQGNLELAADVVDECLEGNWSMDRPILDQLEDARHGKFVGAAGQVLKEIECINRSRGYEVDDWRAVRDAGGSIPRYRQAAVVVQEFVSTIAEHEADSPSRRRFEFGIALSVLCTLVQIVDEQNVIESAGADTKTLLDILLSDSWSAMPEITSAVARTGPRVLPALLNVIRDASREDAGKERAARAVAEMIKLYPGKCNSALPVLIEAVSEDESADLLDACSNALVAFGPDAVKAIGSVYKQPDQPGDIAFSYVLAHIPTEESAKVVLDMLAGTDVLEEWHVRALHDIGSASAIDPLIEYCDPEWVPCARALLLLCEVNGVDRPEMGEWRRTIEESERLMEERLARLQKIMGEGRPRPPASQPGTGHRKLSVKSEKRKRAKARIANLQRKKKRK